MIVYTLDEFAALSKEYKKSLFSISRNQFLSFITRLALFITKYTLDEFLALSKRVEYKKITISISRIQLLPFITKIRSPFSLLILISLAVHAKPAYYLHGKCNHSDLIQGTRKVA